MKLLFDMNLSPRWRVFMADAGMEAVHWSDLGPATAADVEIMAYAAAEGFVVVTHDLDFGSILAVTRGEKPSVVQLRADDVSPEAISSSLIDALRQCEADLRSGALLTLDVARARLSLLPLQRSDG